MTFRTWLMCGALAVSAAAFGSSALAATDSAAATDTAANSAQSSTAVGDVVITARKREESLQRVPVAITAQTGRQLEQQRIVQPTDLGRIVPSLRTFVSSSSDNSAQVALRGQVAGDTLLGISQPVGLYEDTVNIPHPFGANNAFFDLNRVEVLHGPQGTLYGRNTTGGAINVITRDADFNGIHGFVTGEVGNHQSYREGGAVNIPLIEDVLAIRIAFQRWDREGYGHSLITGVDMGGDHHDDLARLSIKWNPLSNVRANMKLEYGYAPHTGQFLANTSLCGIVSGAQVCAPQQAPVGFSAMTFTQRRALALATPNSAFFNNAIAVNPTVNLPAFQDAIFNGNAAAFNQVLAAGQAALAPCVGFTYTNCVGARIFDRLRTTHAVIDVSWDITSAITLRSISGYHAFTDFKDGDLDATAGQILEIGGGSAATGGLQLTPELGPHPVPFPLKPSQASHQFTQEFDLTGKNLLGRIDWLVGFYAASDRGHGSQPSWTNEEIGIALGSAALPNSLTSHDGISNVNNTWAVFTQEDFKITDWFSITAGGRYTREHLTEMLSNWDYNYYTGTYTCEGGNLQSGGIATTILGLAIPVPGQPESCAYAEGVNSSGQFGTAFGPGNSFQNAVFSGWSYLFSANFQITHDILFYGRTARGFRGGAYGRTNAPAAQPEIATDYEIGFKGDFLDHRLRMNIAAYQTDYTNKQVSVLTCNGGGNPPCANGFSTAVVNAAAARMRGVELEGQARPFEGMSIFGNISYLNAEYTKWIGAVSGDGNALCTIKPDLTGIITTTAGVAITANQCVAPNVPPGVTVANPTGNAAGINLGIQPKWQGNIGGRYEHPIGPGVGAIEINYQYIGSVPITPINHQIAVPLAIEQFMQRGVGLVDARVEFNLPDQGLSISVWGSNLTNVYWGREGISATFNGGIGHYLVSDPRMFGITIRKSFGHD